MNREDERNRLFSEQVDVILAGGRADVGPDADGDLRSALNFVQDIVAMTPAPRSGFESALGSRLRTRMAELEETARLKARPSWWQRLVARPTWLVTAAAVLIVAAGIVIWASGLFQPAAGPLPGAVSVTASTDKTRYAAGETVNVRVYLENTTGTYLFLDRYPPNLSIMDAQTHQPVYTSAAGTEDIYMGGRGPIYFDVQWDQRDQSGQAVAPGRYYIELEDLVDSAGQPIPLRLAQPVEFEVLH